MPRFRSNHPKVFLWKGVLEICSKFTGKHPRRTVILIKLQSNFTETHFNMDVLLWNCCIFLEHLFLEVPLGGCVCRFVPHGRCNDALFQLITTGLRSCCVRNALIVQVTEGSLCFPWLSCSISHLGYHPSNRCFLVLKLGIRPLATLTALLCSLPLSLRCFIWVVLLDGLL